MDFIPEPRYRDWRVEATHCLHKQSDLQVGFLPPEKAIGGIFIYQREIELKIGYVVFGYRLQSATPPH
jgi:hypothetical protein